MAKGGGGAGRGKATADPWAGWTTSSWDVRKPGQAASPAKPTKPKRVTTARKERRNAMGGARIAGTTGYSKRAGSATSTGKKEMRDLQNKVTTAARARGITGDKPIPGLGGLTPRNLSRRQFAGSEGEMRAALAAMNAMR